jgi:hypothetical protein
VPFAERRPRRNQPLDSLTSALAAIAASHCVSTVRQTSSHMLLNLMGISRDCDRRCRTSLGVENTRVLVVGSARAARTSGGRLWERIQRNKNCCAARR